MMQFAVLHTTKCHSTKGIGLHIDRKYFKTNVIKTKSCYNENFNPGAENLKNILGGIKENMTLEHRLENEFVPTNPTNDLDDDVQNVIENRYRLNKKVRKDAVKAVSVLLSGSHQRMKEIEKEEKLFNEWKKANYEFACAEFKKENIVRMTLHMDEKTPHFHCVFVPITEEGGLSAKSYLDERNGGKLTKLQTRYAQKMARFGLERGISKEITQRKHIDTNDYYKAVNKISFETIQESKSLSKEELTDSLIKLKVNTRKTIEQTLENVKEAKKLEKPSFKLAYKENKKEQFKKTIDIIKQEIPISEFALKQLDYTEIKEKSTSKHKVLKHALHGTIVVPTTRTKTGDYLYYETHIGSKKGGSLIDLTLKNNWSWREIMDIPNRDYAKTFAKTPNPISFDSLKFSPEKQTRLAKEQLENFKENKRNNILNNKGISPETFKDYNNQIKTNKYTAIFPLYLKEKDVEKRVCSTIKYVTLRGEKTKKYFQKHLPRGLSYLEKRSSTQNITPESKRVFITESPLDALSYKELELQKLAKEIKGIIDPESIILKEYEEKKRKVENTVYISTCGNITKSLEKELEIAIQKSSEVTLGFDNDTAGEQMTKKCEMILKKEEKKYEIKIPKNKDWNEDLLFVLGKEKRKSDRQSLKITSLESKVEKEFKSLKQSNYEDSIFKRSGINLEVIEDLEGLRYDENQVTFLLKNKENEVTNLFKVKVEKRKLQRTLFNTIKEGLVIFNKQENPKTIVFSPSPIDLLKHRQIQFDNFKKGITTEEEISKTMYVSNCSIKETLKRKELRELIFSHPKSNFEISSRSQYKNEIEIFSDMLLRKEHQEHTLKVEQKNGLNYIFSIATIVRNKNINTLESDYENEEEERKKKLSRGIKI